MQDTVIFKKVYKKYWVQQNRDRSHLDKNRRNDFDGVHPFFDVVSIFSDEQSFEKNLKDPLYSLTQSTLKIVIEKKGPKISLKFFTKVFGRKVGTNYYKLKRNMSFLTVNLQTGNIYIGALYNFQNKKKIQKTIRANFQVEESFRSFRIQLKNIISQYDVDESSSVANEICNIFINNIDGGRNDLSTAKRLFKFHLDKKGIKYPNNFSTYSSTIYGDFRKLLKKNEYKIVDTYMLQNNLNGKKLKKVLHTVQNLNIENYKNGLRMFGSDWLNQDEILLQNIFNNNIHSNITENLAKAFNELASLKEKRRAFELYKSFNNDNDIDAWTLRDHFSFYVNLKRYGDTEVEWKSCSNSETFREEHLDWADKISFYKKGEYQRIYSEKYFQILKNFSVDEKDYFPKLLKNSSEYNEESSVQSNCVRTYIGIPSSIIISLREGDETSLTRLTVEYKVSKTPNLPISHISRVQTRAKFNYHPEEIWIKPLEILDKMVENFIVNNNFEKYKLTKKCANGVELESDTEFDEFGKLRWTYQAIDNDINSINFFF